VKTELRKILERHEGRDRAITGMELAKRLNQRDDRRIRILIRELRHEMFPILSSTTSPAGYYLPTNQIEIKECLASLRSRLVEDATTRRDIKIGGGRYLTPAVQERLL